MSITNKAGREFRPPNPSRASRDIPMRSTASCRALIVAQPPAQEHPRVLHAESRLEEKVIYLALANPQLHDLWDQPKSVPFKDATGKTRHHTFDLLATFQNGHKRAIAIKPSAQVYKKDFVSDLRLIAANLPRTFAASVALITERSFKRADALNAERLHHLRKDTDQEADDVLRDFSTSITEPISIADLAVKTGLGGRSYGAAFRALYSGVLKQVKDGIIDLPSHVLAGEALS